MKLEGPAVRLTIFIGETDQYHRRPLYSEIVRRAHRAGLAGASVFRGIEGFGASADPHHPDPHCPRTCRWRSSSSTPRSTSAFLPELDELVTEGLVILDACEVVRHTGPRRGAGS